MTTEAKKAYQRKWMANKRATCEKYREQHRKYSREYGRRHSKERSAYMKRFRLKRDYGITWEIFNQMLADQDGKCAICNCQMDPPARATKDSIAVTVDHCHDTGKVRGLLCYSCNLGIGVLKDSLPRLRAAVAYLERHEWSVRKESHAEGMIEGKTKAKQQGTETHDK